MISWNITFIDGSIGIVLAGGFRVVTTDPVSLYFYWDPENVGDSEQPVAVLSATIVRSIVCNDPNYSNQTYGELQ